MVSEDNEGILAQLIRSRLRDGALQVVRGSQPISVRDVLDLLKGIYAPRDSSIELYGHLAQLCQRPEENVASYFTRSKDLCYQIIEAKESELDTMISGDRKLEVEHVCGRAFVLGLKQKIFALMTEKRDLSKAGPEAIKIERQLAMQEMLRSSSFEKEGSERCIVCDRTGHPMDSCPKLRSQENRCQICDNEGHSAKTCRSKEPTTFCQLCDQPGHLARQCRSSENQPKCGNCYRLGHITRDCRVLAGRDRRCQICGRLGHPAEQCRGSNRESCQICKRFGHSAVDCRYQAPVRVAQLPPICRACSRAGHSEEQCRSFVVCQFCKQTGHIATACPQLTDRSNTPPTQCQYCSKTGHTAERCYQLQSSTRPRQFCSYCKGTNHSVENCFARARQSMAPIKEPEGPGNSRSLPRREAFTERPAKIIDGSVNK